jgi:hypothetical protein
MIQFIGIGIFRMKIASSPRMHRIRATLRDYQTLAANGLHATPRAGIIDE